MVYRCVILAAFGWLILAAGPTPDKTGQPQQPQSASKAERDLDAIANAQGTLAKASDTGEYQRPCADNEKNGKSDLCAQWHAANAGRDAADWAFWALWIGGASAIGLIVTLIFNYLAWQQGRVGREDTRRAIREARRSNLISIASEKRARREAVSADQHTQAALKVAADNASATRDLVQVSKDTAQAQLRAYLNFDGPHFIYDAKDEKEPTGVPVGVGIPIRNFGDTPAINIHSMLTVNFLFYGEPLHSETFEQDLAFITRNDFCTIRANFKVEGKVWKMDDELWEMFSTGEAEMRCVIVVTYDDAFGNIRELSTTFATENRRFRFLAGTRKTT
ncbi:MAG: hypothetical protein ABIR08_03560 [Sphingomonas sp.]